MNDVAPVTTPATTPVSSPDFGAIKRRQQAIWASGDFAKIGVTLQIVGELLCEAADVGPGDRVLDVAAGNGNASLAAARRGADVLAADYVPALLEGAHARGLAEGLALATEVADAEALPFEDGTFDVVLSTFGVMFAPDQERAAGELLRVCRGGGRIGLACWTPDGFIGELLRTVGRFVPPPAGLRSPALWGTEARLTELFGAAVQVRASVRRTFLFRYQSAEHFVDVFQRWYGPTHAAFGALTGAPRLALAQEITALARRYDRSGGGGRLTAAGDYLEVVLEKR